MKRAISLILVALMALMLVPAIGVAAADGTAKSDYVVYLNGTTGADTNDGKTEATAVATLAKAIEIANAYTAATEVVVVVTGETSLGNVQHQILPENTPRICVTGNYDGKDYGSKLVTNTDAPVSLLYLNGDFTFEYINLDCRRDNFILCMQYNNVKIGYGVTVTPLESRKDQYAAWPILLVGCNGDTSGLHDKAVGDPTFTHDVLIEVYSGEWQYFRGGDRDAATTFDGNMEIIIDGIKTKIIASDTSYSANNNNNAPTGKGNYGPNAKITMTVGNCEFYNFIGNVYVQPTPGNVSNADITINIKEGVSAKYFCAVQKNNATFNGKLTVNVYGGDFSEIVKTMFTNQTVVNGGTGTVTINHNPNDPASVAAFTALKNACADDTDVIYGEIAAAPVVTDAPATEAPVVNEAPATQAPVATDAPVVTTEAPAQPEDTPATGDASVMVVFAAAAVLSVAAVVVIKKREN